MIVLHASVKDANQGRVRKRIELPRRQGPRDEPQSSRIGLR